MIVDWPGLIVAMSVLLTALTGSFVALRRQVAEVHRVVNSRYDDLQARLDLAVVQRDEARQAVRDNEEGL